MSPPPPPGLRETLRTTRFTGAGVGVVWAATTLGVVAFFSGHPPVYAVFALLGALAVVGWAGAAYAARRLALRWEGPSRVFAHEEFAVRLTLVNRSPVPLGPVEVRPLATRRGEGHPATVRVPEVPARGSVVAEIPTSLRRRGAHVVYGPGLVVSWPFGLAEASVEPGDAAEVLAYPRRVPVPARALAGASPSREALRSRPTPPRGGDLLRGVREFVPGDAPRAVAWRATARHGRLLSREFEREDRAGVVLLVDADPRDLAPPDRATAVERACSVAASLLLRLRAEGNRVSFGAWTPERTWIPDATSKAGLAAALEALARLHPPRRRDPRGDPVDLVPEAERRGARVLVVSARPGGERRARGRRGTTVVSVGAMRAAFSVEEGA